LNIFRHRNIGGVASQVFFIASGHMSEKKSRNDSVLKLQKIATRIKELRKSSDLTQEQLAEKANIDYKFFQKIETGKRNITVNTLIRICDSLNIALRDFFNFDI
jgi:DNA-binding XRE family transcriptional regulator